MVLGGVILTPLENLFAKDLETVIYHRLSKQYIAGGRARYMYTGNPLEKLESIEF